jgi:LEA14-like dessication related protein
MRARQFSLVAVALLVGCATASAPKPEAEKAPPPPPAAPLQIDTIETAEATLVSFDLKVAGKLGPGVDGKEMQWAVKEDQTSHGSGTVPIEVAADRTFTATVPVVFAKALEDLAVYQVKESIEMTLEATIGGATATRTARLRSPKVPEAKIQSVQATKSGPDTIELTYWFAIDNPNLYPLKLKGIDYKAYLGGKLVADTSTPTDPRIKASAMNEYTFNTQANPTNCGKDIKRMLKTPTMPWQFTGVVHYGTLDVPFSLNGELKLTKE